MQIEKLQIELRPRSPAQALDLGFALLRTCPYPAYMAYAMLMLPLVVLAATLTVLLPKYAMAWLLVPWWFKPIVERGTLYVLSRQVFGTQVSWQEALRAWPSQLGGGSWHLLTWLRLFCPGRSLIQPVWQLENARGSVATERRRILGADGTAGSAYWFGIVCAHFEGVLQFATLYFFHSMFDTAPEGSTLANFFSNMDGSGNHLLNLGYLTMVVAISMLIGPMYTACGFALYLNRRAALEAWDLEIKLRQIVRPSAAVPGARTGSVATAVIASLLCCLALSATPDVMAASMTREQCMQAQPFDRLPTSGLEQQRIRRQVDGLYARDVLSTAACAERWEFKKKPDQKKPDSKRAMPNLAWLATLLKIVAIGAAISIVVWLRYRYRAHFPALQRSRFDLATEVGGLDIRAASLPPNVTTDVMQLWNAGQHRAALALLYRATLSRLVSEDALLLRQGDTEGDCLRLATYASQHQRLSQARLEVTAAATAMWQSAAYGNRWPADEQVHACCANWDRQFPASGRSVK